MPLELFLTFEHMCALPSLLDAVYDDGFIY